MALKDIPEDMKMGADLFLTGLEDYFQAKIYLVCEVDTTIGRQPCDLHPNCNGCKHEICHRRIVIRLPERKVRREEKQ